MRWSVCVAIFPPKMLTNNNSCPYAHALNCFYMQTDRASERMSALKFAFDRESGVLCSCAAGWWCRLAWLAFWSPGSMLQPELHHLYIVYIVIRLLNVCTCREQRSAERSIPSKWAVMCTNLPTFSRSRWCGVVVSLWAGGILWCRCFCAE